MTPGLIVVLAEKFGVVLCDENEETMPRKTDSKAAIVMKNTFLSAKSRMSEEMLTTYR